MNEISLHILDIVQNSIAAGAAHITVEIIEDAAADLLTVIITDDGDGMDEETARNAQEPFMTTRTTRRVGLGLPLFKEGCLACGGTFRIESLPGKGTAVTGSYRMSHIDRPPLGNMADTAFLIVAANPELDFEIRHGADGKHYAFGTSEARRVLGDVPLDDPDVQGWIRDYLSEAENDLHGGA